ncbi:MAG: hypothetical protein H0X38_07465 [Planctomycetes bacterium]|nr:hypothetical protein [Planctomycetota bacterium]
MASEDFIIERHTDGWHVRMHGGASQIFRNREQAEAFAHGALAGGASGAQSQTGQGDVAIVEHHPRAPGAEG